jgi:hypothetical protein
MIKQLKLLYLIYICERRYVKLARRCLNKFNKHKDENISKAYKYALLTDRYIRKGEECADKIDELFEKED